MKAQEFLGDVSVFRALRLCLILHLVTNASVLPSGSSEVQCRLVESPALKLRVGGGIERLRAH